MFTSNRDGFAVRVATVCFDPHRSGWDEPPRNFPTGPETQRETQRDDVREQISLTE